MHVIYINGLKPLASILSIRIMGKAQTHIRNTKHKSRKSDLLSLYYYLVSRSNSSLVVTRDLAISPRSLFPARNGTDAPVRLTCTASRRDSSRLHAEPGRKCHRPLSYTWAKLHIWSVVLFYRFNSYNKYINTHHQTRIMLIRKIRAK